MERLEALPRPSVGADSEATLECMSLAAFYDQFRHVSRAALECLSA